jgi:peptidoglycan/LPS O-acetylase OafA/YrhL
VLPACARHGPHQGHLPSWTLPAGLLLISLALRRYHTLGGLVRFLPLFAVEMLAFEGQTRASIRQALAAPWIAIPALVSLAIGMVSEPTLVFAPTLYHVVQIALYGFFFVCVVCGNDLAGFLRTRGSLVLGECSYGINLLHGTILSVVFVDAASAIHNLSANELPLLLPAIATAVVCMTAITHVSIEHPAIRAGRMIAKRRSHRQLRIDDSLPKLCLRNKELLPPIDPPRHSEPSRDTP